MKTSEKTLVIDGSFGEGGGQILRSSLALSAITQTPIRIEKIRAHRRKPGLMRQHLTAVHAASNLCDAKLEGDTLGSSELTFMPGKIHAGNYKLSIGTAGSTMLVFQTILPALLMAEEVSTVEIHGGTHNDKAPTFDFVERAFLPVLKRMGCRVDLTLIRAGFYPAGGGAIRAEIHPVKKFKRIKLLERGEQQERLAVASLCHLAKDIGERELTAVAKRLNLGPEELSLKFYQDSVGFGNVLRVELAYKNIREIITQFGERNVSAESVGKQAAKEACEYLSSKAPVGEYLADQLILPMALAGGGSFRATNISQHFTTNVHVIQQFLNISVETEQEGRRCWKVKIS